MSYINEDIDEGWTTTDDLERICDNLGVPLTAALQKDKLQWFRQFHEPNKPANFIVNLQSSEDGNGTHWVGLYIPKNRGSPAVYFDSYGVVPPIEVINYVHSLGITLKYNNSMVQGIDEAYCGQWVSLFLAYMNKKGNYKDNYNKFMSNFKEIEI